MKIIVSKNTLQSALHRIAQATPTRSTIPILNNVLLSTISDHAMTLRTTDTEMGLIKEVETEVGENGSICVEHKTLNEIVNEMPDTNISISADSENKISISTNFGNYELVGVNPDEFPAIPQIDNNKNVVINSKTLQRLIGKTTFAMSTDELKPALMGTLFEFNENGVNAIATDGHKLAVCARTDFKSKGYTGNVIVPRKFLKFLPQHLEEQDEITLSIGENYISVSFEKTTAYSRIIDERYPDYKSVLPKDNEKKVKGVKDEVLSSIRRVSILSNRTTRQIVLHLGPDNCTISTEDPEKASSAKEDIALEYTSEKMNVGYNANYLIEIISHLDTENFLMHLKTPISAGLIFPEKQQENEELTMLLMPMRTGKE